MAQVIAGAWVQSLAQELPIVSGYEINTQKSLVFLFSFLFFFVFCPFRAAHVAYGVSQDRGLIGAVAAGLRQSNGNARSEPHLRPTPQLTATPDS